MNKDTPVVEIKPDQNARMYTQPDPAASDSERDPIWYIDNLKYICSFYDQWFNTILASQNGRITNNAGNTSSQNNSFGGFPSETPVNRMIRMMSYLNGWQPNLNYAHLTPNVTSTNLMPTWIRGQKVYSVLNVRKDVMSQLLANVDFDVNNMTEEAQGKKKKLLDNLMIQYEMKKALEQVSNSTGVNVDFSGGKQFEFPEDVKYYIEEGYKDMDSEILTKIAKSLWIQHSLEDKFLQSFIKDVSTTARAGVEHTVVNGKQMMNFYKPYELIPDPRFDDDYQRNAQFAGYVKYYSPNDLFALYPQMLKHKEKVLEMAREQSMGLPYNTMSNMTWWVYGNGQQRGQIGLVKAYFKTLRPEGRKEITGKYGKKVVVKVRDNEDGQRMVEDVCTGTLIGNKWMTNYGYCTNVQEDFYDKSKVKLPLFIFMPNMNLGDSVSIVSRLSDLSDERDAIRLKIREHIGKSKGKGFFVKSWKFGNSANQKAMMQDLSTTGLVVLTHSGEPEDFRDDNGDVLEPIDMTLDPNVIKLQEVIATIDQEIMEIAKISSSALGNDQVQKYMGAGVAQNAMQQGSGNSSDYSSFIHFVQMNLQYAVDVAKYLFTEDDTDYPTKVIGERGVEYLKLSKSIRYSDPLTCLTISPFIGKEERNTLINAANMIAGQGGMGMLDYIHVLSSKTMPELRNKLEFALKQKESKDEHEKAMLAAIDQLHQQNQQLVQQIQMFMQQAGNDRARVDTQGHNERMAIADSLGQMQPPGQAPA